uniref:Olduvai domain-containing protein n=1 Tax=Sus scrofa TaxID=9823 RepID=A0A8D0MVF6_PIG
MKTRRRRPMKQQHSPPAWKCRRLQRRRCYRNPRMNAFRPLQWSRKGLTAPSLRVMAHVHLMSQKLALLQMEPVLAPTPKRMTFQPLTQHSAELQEVAKEEVLQAVPDEAVLAPCIQQEGSDCYPPCSDGKLAFDEQKKGSVLDGACGCSPATEGEIPAGPPENPHDRNGVKEPEPPVPRLRGELPPMAECGVPLNSLDGSAWSCPGLPDLSDSFWPYRSAATLSFENMDVPDAHDATSDTWGDCHKVPLSFGRPEMQSSQAQLQTSTQVANDLQLPLSQHLDRGDGKARLRLSSNIQGFTANTDTGNQGPLFRELGLDASIGMKTPPKLEGEGSAASRQECHVCHRLHALSFLKEKIIQRKLQFSKWRLACRFPGLLA